jgi:toxin ParE1/3/4
MVVIKWTDQALDDLRNIAEFISRDSVKYSKIQVRRLMDRTLILRNQPIAGRIVPELKNEYIRELILGNYRIVYRIVSKRQVDILTVHHSSRLMSNNPHLEQSGTI